jgi:uncharacterized protein YkwD
MRKYVMAIGSMVILSVLAPVAVATEASSAASIEAEIVRLTNVERARKGLRPVQANTLLNTAAVRHAANMARQNRMSHVLDGKDPSERLQDAGYAWQMYGENVAYGFPDAAAVVKGWMNSPGHRRNLLNPDVTEIGVGVETSRAGRPYFCQVFGRPQ